MRPQIRLKLAQDGAHPFCDEDGATLGDGVALLEKDASGRWSPRPQAQLEGLLSLGYGGPVELSSRMGWLRQVAKYLNDGKVGQAGIALLHAQLPPLPSREAARRMAKADRLGKRDEVHWPAGAPDSQGGQFEPNAISGLSYASTKAKKKRRAHSHLVKPKNNPKTVLSYKDVYSVVSGNSASGMPNNRSGEPDELLLAIAYKESKFHPGIVSQNEESSATGLYQTTGTAVKEVNDITGSNFNIYQMQNPENATIVMSEYLKILLKNAKHGLSANVNQNEILKAALLKYRGPGEPDYADTIIRMTEALQKHPADPIAAMEAILHPSSKDKNNV